GLGLAVSAQLPARDGKIGEDKGHVGMLFAALSYSDSHRALQQGHRLFETTLLDEHPSEVVECRGEVWMVRPKDLPVDRDIAAKVALGRGKVLPHIGDFAERVEIVADGRAQRPFGLSPELQ